MNKNLFSAALIFMVVWGSAQVGINTNNPQVTLDVRDNATVTNDYPGIRAPMISGDDLRAITYTTNQNGAIVYVTAADSAPAGQTINVTDAGYYYFDSVSNQWKRLMGNSGGAGVVAYAAARYGAWSLLSLNLLNTYAVVDLSTLTTKPNLADGSINNGQYVVPETGIYKIEYEWQLDSGVDISILGTESLAIVKNGTTEIAKKIFDGIRISLLGVTLANVPLTTTTLSELVYLDAGDQLAFAVTNGVLGLGLLSQSNVSVNIYKIGDN